jgi:thioredoxin-related protein
MSAMGMTMGSPGFAANVALPLSSALDADLQRALQAKQPLVVLVSLDGCPYCNAARRSFLVPMRQQGQIDVVQLDMRSSKAVVDFDGRSRTHEQMIQAWGVKVAPTLLFFGPKGAEVADRMVGGYLPDFYGAYLDERLQQARRTLM